MSGSPGAAARLLDTFRMAAAEVSDTGVVPILTLGTPLAVLAFDSVQLAELLCALEERLGVRTTPERYFSAETVGDVLAVLGSEHAARRSA